MYPGTPGETRYRFDDIFRTTLTEKNFVDADDEPYDDGFAEFRTIRAVLVNAGVITISDDVDIPDDF